MLKPASIRSDGQAASSGFGRVPVSVPLFAALSRLSIGAGLALLSVLRAPFGRSADQCRRQVSQVWASPAGPADQRRASERAAFPPLRHCEALARPLWRLRRYQSSPLLECVQRAGRINAWRSPDELDHLLKLGSAELRHNLVDASLMQQQNSRDNGFGHALGGGPAHIVWMKKNAKTIRHVQEYIPIARRMHASLCRLAS